MEKSVSPLEHGGSLRKNRRKIARPFCAKRPIHVTMRSSRARGAWSFLHRSNKGIVHLLVLDTAERYDIRIHKWQNVGNHLHLVVQATSRKLFQSFLRVLPQRIVFAVTGTRKNNPIGRFFDEIAHSRVVNWGQEFQTVLNYVWKNTLEALGFSRSEISAMRQAAREAPI